MKGPPITRFVSQLLIAMIPGALAAQTLAERLGGVEDGAVRLSFSARPGTCSDGAGNGRQQDASLEWQPDCGPRLVRVALEVRERKVSSIRTYVGGHWRPASAVIDLGTVSSIESARYFIGLAEETANGGLSGDPLLPAVLADSATIWPSLIGIARSSGLPQEIRGRAVFWLGQAAGAAAGQALDSIAGDRQTDLEIRKHAVFALSQRPNDESVPALIKVARTSPVLDLRKTALFWLAQSEDSRAVDLFEEILR
jgi:hypothetical protein